MKKIYYHKLVRDQIPENIKAQGGTYLIRKLKPKEFERALIKKVGEESDGIVNAKTRKDLISELGDVLDVIETIKKLKRITTLDIVRAQREALKRKGWFNKHLYLVWSSDTGYRSNERTYKK